jgi:hypothetical protein
MRSSSSEHLDLFRFRRMCGPAFVAAFGLISACASEPTPPPEYPAMEAPPAAAASAAATPEPPRATALASPATPPPPPVQVVAAENTPLEGAAPTLHISAPRDGQLYKGDKVEIALDVKNWLLTPDGNHIHVIVDNEPYIAVRDASKPIDLRALVQKELGHDLAEGTHTLRAFPGRGHHESVKDAGAFDVKTFHFKKKSADLKFDAKAPLLTFSRPKGCVDLGAHALLDFFVANLKLGAAEDRVHYSIDGTISGDIVAWTPHFIENLPEGEHRLQLTLQDANGAAIAGPYNDTARTFRVAKDCKAATAPVATAPSVTPTARAQRSQPRPCGSTRCHPERASRRTLNAPRRCARRRRQRQWRAHRCDVLHVLSAA